MRFYHRLYLLTNNLFTSIKIGQVEQYLAQESSFTLKQEKNIMVNQI
jgi:hypothetical protein